MTGYPLPLPGGFSHSYELLVIVEIAVTGMTASRSATYRTSGPANHFPLPRPLSALGGHRYSSSSFRLEVKACREIKIGASSEGERRFRVSPNGSLEVFL